ncbi:MAG: hypothetical protein OXU21_13335 [Chloroflexota bacterium]|nr:hypothetical protein [Chloroflexota bacterium]
MASRRRSTRRRRRDPVRRIPETLIPAAPDAVRTEVVTRPPRGEQTELPGLPFLRRDLAGSLTILAVLIVGLVVTSVVI